MRSLPGNALPVRVDHTGNTKLVRLIAPTKCQHYVWRIGCVDFCLGKRKGSIHPFSGEDDTGKIRSLQKLNQPVDYRRIVLHDIKEHTAAAAHRQEFTRLRFRLE